MNDTTRDLTDLQEQLRRKLSDLIESDSGDVIAHDAATLAPVLKIFKDGKTALYEAVATSKLDAVTSLLKIGSDIFEGQTPPHPNPWTLALLERNWKCLARLVKGCRKDQCHQCAQDVERIITEPGAPDVYTLARKRLGLSTELGASTPAEPSAIDSSPPLKLDKPIYKRKGPSM